MYRFITFSLSLILVVTCAASDKAATEERASSEYLAAPVASVQLSENLYLLGKVWGFLKYHHPEVTSGKRDWDRDLFRVLPAVLNATDNGQAKTRILTWIDELGEVSTSESETGLPNDFAHAEVSDPVPRTDSITGSAFIAEFDGVSTVRSYLIYDLFEGG